jgi:hypothetical protein
LRFSEKKAIAPYPAEGKDMEIAAKKIEELEKSLGEVRGQRRQSGNLRHKLADILAIAFTALLCGLKDYEDREKLSREKERKKDGSGRFLNCLTVYRRRTRFNGYLRG